MKRLSSLFKSSNKAPSKLPNYEEATSPTPPPPTYTRLSELHITSFNTVRAIDLAFRSFPSDKDPLFILHIDRGNDEIVMNLSEVHSGSGGSKGKKGGKNVVGNVYREGKGDYVFEVGVGVGGEGEVRMNKRMAGVWSFEVPVVESARSIAAEEGSEIKGEEVIAPPPCSSSSLPSPKTTTFAWRLLTPAPSANTPRQQKTFIDPDIQLINFTTGEIHAAYFTNLDEESVGRVRGQMQFRRSFGQAWEYLVIIGLGALLEGERRRRESRGSFAMGSSMGLITRF